MFNWKDFVFADWIPGIISIIFFGFVVVAILLEITFKKACNSLIKKTDDERKKAVITTVKVSGSLLLSIVASVYVAVGAVNDGLLPGGVLLTLIWIGIVYIAQYFGSLYAIKGLQFFWEVIKAKLKAEPKPKTMVERRKYTVDANGNKQYIEG